MIINSVDDLNLAPPLTRLILLLGATPGWLGLSAQDLASRISALEAAGVEPPPEPVLPTDPPAATSPDWDAFNQTAMIDPALNQAIATATPLAPLAVYGLPAALAQVEQGRLTAFESAYTAIISAAQVSEATRAGWRAIADAANLPQAFKDIL